MKIENRKILIQQAVDTGIAKYIASRREKVDVFVENNFSVKEAWQLNKAAFGYDLLKAPANVIWSPFYFILSLSSKGMSKVSKGKVQLNNLPAGFSTAVEKEVQWRVYNNFLELPIEIDARQSEKNKLLEIILTDESLQPIFEQGLLAIADLAQDSNGESTLTENLLNYVDSRKAASELSATLIGAATGFATTKSLQLGSLGLGQSLAGTLAYHSAVSSFAFGNTLGGLYYSIMPVSVSTGAIVLSTGGVAALLGVVSAFGGMIADPLQKSLGLHQKRLHKLLDSIEEQLTSTDSESLKLKDGYVARVLDLADLLMTLVVKR